MPKIIKNKLPINKQSYIQSHETTLEEKKNTYSGNLHVTIKTILTKSTASGCQHSSVIILSFFAGEQQWQQQ